MLQFVLKVRMKRTRELKESKYSPSPIRSLRIQYGYEDCFPLRIAYEVIGVSVNDIPVGVQDSDQKTLGSLSGRGSLEQNLEI